MRVKISDYIADFLVRNGIEDVFTVVGGGAMHLNDSFGHHPKLHCTYFHHEQAAAMAAEAYSRIHGKIALLCVTSGPGAINALNGVAGAYQDSIPMLVISGQMKTVNTVKHSGLDLRTLGGQEFEIVSALSHMAKYAEMITSPIRIRYAMEKALFVARDGRPGPCWLDIPVDVQGKYVDTDQMFGFDYAKSKDESGRLNSLADEVLERVKRAERPVIYAGNGIRLSGAAGLLDELARTLSAPVVTCWDSIDLIDTDNRYYCGRGGTMGDRPGNFAVQNCDLLISIGSRLNIYQVGYNVNTWARAAYTIVNDIDSEELFKPTIRVDMPVCADAGDFIRALLKSAATNPVAEKTAWVDRCESWKKNYPVVREEQKNAKGQINPYAFFDRLSRSLPENSITVVANGSASVMGSHSYYIKKNDRFIMNCGISSMGYGLPASIGACIANDRKEVVCIEGDGSIMMNLQELQTIVTNHLSIRIFVINNNGYHQVRQTQDNVFHDGYVGVGPESHDLGFPNMEKLAAAFGLPYYSLNGNENLQEKVEKILGQKPYFLCEVFVDEKQKFEPKSATKKLGDGTLVSPPLEDLAPFLPREELAANMIIPMVPESNW